MDILTQIINLIIEFNPVKFSILLLVFVVILMLFPYIDQNLLFNWQIQNRIGVLDNMSKLNLEKISKDKRLQNEYNRILDALEKHYQISNLNSLSMLASKETTKIKLFKFITGGSLFWFLLIILPFAKYNDSKTRFAALIIITLIGCLFGFIGLKLPTFNSIYINYIGFPVAQFILILVVTMNIGNSNKNKLTNVPNSK